MENVADIFEMDTQQLITELHKFKNQLKCFQNGPTNIIEVIELIEQELMERNAGETIIQQLITETSKQAQQNSTPNKKIIGQIDGNIDSPKLHTNSSKPIQYPKGLSTIPLESERTQYDKAPQGIALEHVKKEHPSISSHRVVDEHKHPRQKIPYIEEKLHKYPKTEYNVASKLQAYIHNDSNSKIDTTARLNGAIVVFGSKKQKKKKKTIPQQCKESQQPKSAAHPPQVNRVPFKKTPSAPILLKKSCDSISNQNTSNDNQSSSLTTDTRGHPGKIAKIQSISFANGLAIKREIMTERNERDSMEDNFAKTEENNCGNSKTMHSESLLSQPENVTPESTFCEFADESTIVNISNSNVIVDDYPLEETNYSCNILDNVVNQTARKLDDKQEQPTLAQIVNNVEPMESITNHSRTEVCKENSYPNDQVEEYCSHSLESKSVEMISQTQDETVEEREELEINEGSSSIQNGNLNSLIDTISAMSDIDQKWNITQQQSRECVPVPVIEGAITELTLHPQLENSIETKNCTQTETTLNNPTLPIHQNRTPKKALSQKCTRVGTMEANELISDYSKIYTSFLDIFSGLSYAPPIKHDVATSRFEPEQSTLILKSVLEHICPQYNDALNYVVQSARDEVLEVVENAVAKCNKQWVKQSTAFHSWNLLWTWKPPQIERHKLLVWQRVNHFSNAKHLTRKDLLCKHLSRLRRLSVKASDEFNIMPLSFVIPQEYVEFTEAFSNNTKGQKNIWIMKPTSSSRGRGIKLIDSIGSVQHSEGMVIQKYVENPLLLDGYKFDLRLYVVVTHVQPLEAFLYKEGFARICTETFSLESNSLSNKFIHLTNTAIQQHSATGSNRMHLSELKHFLLGKDINVDELWEKITCVIIKSLIAVEDLIATIPHTLDKKVPNINSFELFGYDILIDETLKVWLLEVNSSPSMEQSNQLDELKKDLVQDTINLVDPLKFDHVALREIIQLRLDQLQSHKLVRQLNTPQELNKDLSRILYNKMPRLAGEMPEQLGQYERIAPSQWYKKIAKMKRV